ncbi:hypothetical protein D9619_011291 [Psilocybe cf. subviscida]|uniref:Uncharacterized protein n=1 Tax=Psilocybe cf. subviscida TaxID=2480587 RepID=A0A8H5BKR0_9AGAR|nr:hypothetical protein D9619_011291 [Psilocybe cf. subviscida]
MTKAPSYAPSHLRPVVESTSKADPTTMATTPHFPWDRFNHSPSMIIPATTVFTSPSLTSPLSHTRLKRVASKPSHLLLLLYDLRLVALHTSDPSAHNHQQSPETGAPSSLDHRSIVRETFSSNLPEEIHESLPCVPPRRPSQRDHRVRFNSDEPSPTSAVVSPFPPLSRFLLHRFALDPDLLGRNPAYASRQSLPLLSTGQSIARRRGWRELCVGSEPWQLLLRPLRWRGRVSVRRQEVKKRARRDQLRAPLLLNNDRAS